MGSRLFSIDLRNSDRSIDGLLEIARYDIGRCRVESRLDAMLIRISALDEFVINDSCDGDGKSR